MHNVYGLTREHRISVAPAVSGVVDATGDIARTRPRPRPIRLAPFGTGCRSRRALSGRKRSTQDSNPMVCGDGFRQPGCRSRAHRRAVGVPVGDSGSPGTRFRVPARRGTPSRTRPSRQRTTMIAPHARTAMRHTEAPPPGAGTTSGGAAVALGVTGGHATATPELHGWPCDRRASVVRGRVCGGLTLKTGRKGRRVYRLPM